MKNIFTPKVYMCKCGTQTKEYIWLDELKTKKVNCKECGTELGYKNIPKIESGAAIRTPTKNR
jgi:predicted SprT family Zn-dependent metalloprotease